MITLHDAVIPGFLQMLGGLQGVLDKGMQHATERGIDPLVLADARLVDNMFPLHLQIRRVVDHSSGALADIERGSVTRPRQDPCGYADMQRLLVQAEDFVRARSPEEVNALEGREIAFELGSSRRIYTAEAYLLLFSLPNFYFHGVTAYDILRAQGVPIGKRDYLSHHRTTLR